MLLIIYYIWYDDVIDNHDVMMLWIIWSYIFRYDIDDHDMMMLLMIIVKHLDWYLQYIVPLPYSSLCAYYIIKVPQIHELRNKKSYHTTIETQTHMNLVSFYYQLWCIRTVAQVLEWGPSELFFNSLWNICIDIYNI